MKRKLLVNRSFQLKSGAWIMLLTLALTAPVLLLLGGNAYLNSKNITSSMNTLEKAVTDEQRIVDDFVKYSRRLPRRWVNPDGSIERAYLKVEEVNKKHGENVAVFMEFSRLIRESTERNARMVYVIIGIMALQAVFLFYFMLRFTHRIAGPVYHMERMVRDMAEGRTPDTRPLRDKDKLKKLHEAILDLHQNRIKVKNPE